MTTPSRIKVLIDAVNHVSRNKIDGDFVECGVWRGGSSMIAADTFLKLKDYRHIYLFDAFDLPIPAPVQSDKDVFGTTILGGAAKAQPYWNAVSEEEVKNNMCSTGYPESNIHTIKGLVNDTVPYKGPKKISILRLDTDTYESTVHTLLHFFPRLSQGGILILDDYGCHLGVRKATDEFLVSHNKIFLTRIDNSGAVAVKI